MKRSKVPTGNGERILTVDDEPALLEMMEKMVSELQYSVRTVASPQAALDLLRAGEVFDLLLTDTVMSGLNGFELAQGTWCRIHSESLASLQKTSRSRSQQSC